MAKRDVAKPEDLSSQINFINASVNEAKLELVKDFFIFYHRRWWCYRKTYLECKRSNPSDAIDFIAERKIEMCRYAYKTYEKVLSDLRSCLQGKPFLMERFICKMACIDHSITDLCPSISCAIEKQYEDRFFDEDLEVIRTHCVGLKLKCNASSKATQLFQEVNILANMSPVRP